MNHHTISEDQSAGSGRALKLLAALAQKDKTDLASPDSTYDVNLDILGVESEQVSICLYVYMFEKL